MVQAYSLRKPRSLRSEENPSWKLLKNIRPVNERNGDLASLMTNTVFEEAERVGTNVTSQASTSYADIAEDMMNALPCD